MCVFTVENPNFGKQLKEFLGKFSSEINLGLPLIGLIKQLGRLDKKFSTQVDPDFGIAATNNIRLLFLKSPNIPLIFVGKFKKK